MSYAQFVASIYLPTWLASFYVQNMAQLLGFGRLLKLEMALSQPWKLAY